jgi:hypothetical protein
VQKRRLDFEDNAAVSSNPMMKLTDKERMTIGVKSFLGSQAATLSIPALPVLAALSVAAALIH